ncbi:MAG: DUF4091 domain-containing protein [Clostridia bacterium]|nr:DUF4091 domain-containing protein [Clostridia bacterium]
MIKAKIISSLEKAFVDLDVDSFEQIKRLSALKGERINLQMVYCYDKTDSPKMTAPLRIAPVLSGELAPYASLRAVESVPVLYPTHPDGTDDNYLRVTPGLYPDVLRPLYYGGRITLNPSATCAVWVEINIPTELDGGPYSLRVELDGGELGSAVCEVEVEVIGAELPSEDIYFTQWFHADCLANYYNVEVWSDRHFEIVESFVRTARRNGINMILTPIFTPPLDTAIGGERRTTQLVGVELSDGEYRFDFTLLDRWIEMLNRCGVEYIEFSHLFTQWGAKHAPKIIARVDGEDKKLFGWHTDAHGEEYVGFLHRFIPELLSHMEARGDGSRCFFHISDEPHELDEEDYKRSKASVADLLRGYTVMDALSDVRFYEKGIIEHPIPSNDVIAPFIEAGVPGLWTYYCMAQPLEVSNRFHSMPGWRNRSIGMQIYKFGIVGFLHWGYNFYNNQYSADQLNPYLDQSCDFAFPGGDSNSVYPAPDGTALESMRLAVFYEALEDIKAMKLAESLTSHAYVVAEMEAVFGSEITFATCAKSAAMMHAIRERVNEIIKENL